MVLLLDDLKHSFDLRTRPGLDKVMMSDSLIENLFGFFLLYYFKYNYNLFNRKYQYNFNPDLTFTEKVIEFIKLRDFKNKDIILLYYYMFISHLKHDNEKYFLELRAQCKKCIHLLDRNEQTNIYIGMQTYCQAKMNGKKFEYKHVLFEICKEMIAKGIYSSWEDGTIHPLIYKTITKAGTAVKQFEWVHTFAEQHRKKLPLEFQFNVYNYCLAYYMFYKGDYENSQKHLSVVKYEYVYNKVEVKRLLMQIYYEMGLTEELLSLTDTFKHFLYNDKLVSEETKKVNLDFIHLLNTAYKLKISENPGSDLQNFKKELDNTVTFEMEWFYKKAEELEK